MSITRYCNPKLRARILAGDVPAWLKRHIRSQYIIQVCLSTPPWLDRKALYAMRDIATLETKCTGHRHVLAHKTPVTHAKVCGLTVPWNLEIKYWRKNASESNKWCDEDHEQHELPLPRQHTLNL